MDRLKELVLEYKRLLEEAENSQGLDQEEIPVQLAKIKKEYKALTGKDITKEVL